MDVRFLLTLLQEVMGDLNGYNISFEGKEVLPSLFVLSTLVGVGVTAGFDVQTANMSNE